MNVADFIQFRPHKTLCIFFGLLNDAALRQLRSTFEVAIQLSLAGEQATTHQIQEEAQAFH